MSLPYRVLVVVCTLLMAMGSGCGKKKPLSEDGIPKPVFLGCWRASNGNILSFREEGVVTVTVDSREVFRGSWSARGDFVSITGNFGALQGDPRRGTETRTSRIEILSNSMRVIDSDGTSSVYTKTTC